MLFQPQNAPGTAERIILIWPQNRRERVEQSFATASRLGIELNSTAPIRIFCGQPLFRITGRTCHIEFLWYQISQNPLAEQHQISRGLKGVLLVLIRERICTSLSMHSRVNRQCLPRWRLLMDTKCTAHNIIDTLPVRRTHTYERGKHCISAKHRLIFCPSS